MPMERSGLLLPLNIIASHLEMTPSTVAIRKNLVNKTFQTLETVDTVPVSEKTKLLALIEKISSVEGALANAIKSKIYQ